MTLLEDFPDFILWQDATCDCLYATWHGPHDSQRTQTQYALIRKHALAFSSRKLLNDGLLDENGWAEITDWIANHGFRHLAEAGVEAVAWVLPRQPAAFFDTARVLAQLRQPLVDIFTDTQAAYDWLHRWPQTPPVEGGLSAAGFLLLPTAQQVALAAEQGRTLVPRWEVDYYIKCYEMPNGLLVEVVYHLHSGVFYQVRVLR